MMCFPVYLQVVKQCCMTDGVEPHYIKEEVLPHFFKHFWNQRMALDRRNFRQVSWGQPGKGSCGVGKGSCGVGKGLKMYVVYKGSSILKTLLYCIIV